MAYYNVINIYLFISNIDIDITKNEQATNEEKQQQQQQENLKQN